MRPESFALRVSSRWPRAFWHRSQNGPRSRSAFCLAARPAARWLAPGGCIAREHCRLALLASRFAEFAAEQQCQ